MSRFEELDVWKKPARLSAEALFALAVALQNVHKDPADRIIIATAIAHDALLASVDSVFPALGEIEWVNPLIPALDE